MSVKIEAKKATMWDYGFVEDGHHYWWASWYAKILGYSSLQTLSSVLEKSKKVCLHLGIKIEPNFIEDSQHGHQDVKLSKFACFLVALQADARKPVVKKARSYFLNELEDLNILLTDNDFMNRMVGREELSILSKKLNKSARRAHVKDFQYFVNEGYLGMYNMTSSELKESRQIDPRLNMSDYMSMTELAGNIFRISLTEERLKRLRNPSQAIAAREHWKVGQQIRTMIHESTGRFPEQLVLHGSLKNLQKLLKKTQKTLNQQIAEVEELEIKTIQT